MLIPRTKLSRIVRHVESVDAIADAEHILKNHRLNSDLPIDPVAIAHNMGFEISTEDGTVPDLFVSTMVYSPNEKVICLRHSDSPDRQRCACSHVLGHHVNFIRNYKGDKHDFGTDRVHHYSQLPYLEARSFEILEKYERHANVFAGFLLMPLVELPQYYDTKIAPPTPVLNPSDVSKRFGVSLPAAESHLAGLFKLHERLCRIDQEDLEEKELEVIEEELVEYWVNWVPPEEELAS